MKRTHSLTLPQTRWSSAVKLILAPGGLHMHVLQDRALVAVMVLWWRPKLIFVCQNWRYV